MKREPERESAIDWCDVTKLKPSWKSIFRALCQKLIRLYCNRIWNSIVNIHTQNINIHSHVHILHKKEKNARKQTHVHKRISTLTHAHPHSRTGCWNDSIFWLVLVYWISSSSSSGSGGCFPSLVCLFVCLLPLQPRTVCTLYFYSRFSSTERKSGFFFQLCCGLTWHFVFHIETTQQHVHSYVFVRAHRGMHAYTYCLYNNHAKNGTQFTCARISIWYTNAHSDTCTLDTYTLKEITVRSPFSYEFPLHSHHCALTQICTFNLSAHITIRGAGETMTRACVYACLYACVCM